MRRERKVLVVGDVHLTDPKSAPSVRSSDYTEDILAKLQFCVDEASKRHATLLILGDLYHLKMPSRTSHWLVQRTHDVLTSGTAPVIVVPGNHDVRHDRLDTLDAQPLGALGRMDGIEILVGVHDDLPIYGIPYLQDWAALPGWFHEYREERAARPDSDAEWILAMHAPIFPPGQDPPYDYLASEDVANALSGEKSLLVAYGHIHDPHNFYTPSPDGPTFANLGAISRGSLHAETLKRKPQVYVYDTNDGGIEVIDVPHRPIEEVFALQAVLAKKDEEATMTKFLEGLDSSALTMTSVESVVQAAREAELDGEVVEAVVGLIEQTT